MSKKSTTLINTSHNDTSHNQDTNLTPLSTPLTPLSTPIKLFEPKYSRYKNFLPTKLEPVYSIDRTGNITLTYQQSVQNKDD